MRKLLRPLCWLLRRRHFIRLDEIRDNYQSAVAQAPADVTVTLHHATTKCSVCDQDVEITRDLLADAITRLGDLF